MEKNAEVAGAKFCGTTFDSIGNFEFGSSALAGVPMFHWPFKTRGGAAADLSGIELFAEILPTSLRLLCLFAAEPPTGSN